jgi:hypothetical protein
MYLYVMYVCMHVCMYVCSFRTIITFVRILEDCYRYLDPLPVGSNKIVFLN